MEGERKLGLDVRVIGRKSWVAYVAISASYLLLAAIVGGIIYAASNNPAYAAVGVAIVALIYLIQFAQLRSYRLYVDRDGVWIFSGIFPWSKGTQGVRWRDLDDAVYFTNFVSWFTQSYNIVIRHKFTKTSEIIMTAVWKGSKAVHVINDMHTELVHSQPMTADEQRSHSEAGV